MFFYVDLFPDSTKICELNTRHAERLFTKGRSFFGGSSVGLIIFAGVGSNSSASGEMGNEPPRELAVKHVKNDRTTSLLSGENCIKSTSLSWNHILLVK